MHSDDCTLTCAYISFHNLNNQLPPSIIINSITNIAKGTGKHIQLSSHGKELNTGMQIIHSMFLSDISCLSNEAEKWKVTIFHPHQWLHRRAVL
jgi:hypothetical protein